jgi:hypothetical protein
LKRHSFTHRTLFLLALTICATFAMAGNAFAFSAPSQGDMWFELYEVFYDKLVEGPLGAACVGGILTWGILAAIRGSVFQFAVCSCAAAIIFSLETVVSSLGMIA